MWMDVIRKFKDKSLEKVKIKSAKVSIEKSKGFKDKNNENI